MPLRCSHWKKPSSKTCVLTLNLFEHSDACLIGRGFSKLPEDLGQAITLFENSELMKETLGEHIHSYLVSEKKAEWASYLGTVSQWELERYLAVL